MIFLSPLFLIGLLALLIPIAIHLFNFRRYRVIYFSNVDALQELQQETRKQSRLREILILLARLLAILFLVLAFAQPVIPRAHQQVAQGSTAVSVYVDNSFSAENRGKDGSLLDEALQKAREIVDAYQPDDLFQLVTNDLSGDQFRWLSKDEFLQALQEVSISPATPLLSAVVQRQLDFMEHSATANRELYLISDFQQSVTDIVALPQDSLAHLIFVPLEGDKQDNIFIDTLVLNAPAYYRGNTIKAQITIQNTSKDKQDEVPVRLYINNRERAMNLVDIPAEGKATVELAFAVDEIGCMEGYVALTDYPICFDDSLFFSINVKEQIRVLELTEGASNQAISKLFHSDSAVSFASCQVNRLDFSLLDGPNFIILNELSSISSGLSDKLSSFVDNGGSLLILPGEKCNLDGYNLLLSNCQAPLLGQYQHTKGSVEHLNLENALYNNVFESKVENMEKPVVDGYYRVQRGGNSLYETLMRMGNGDEYLTVTQKGSGKLFLFSAPLRVEHTSLVQQALVVPTIFNMALYSLPQGAPYSVLGATFPVPLPLSRMDEICHLTNKDKNFDIIPDVRLSNGCYALFVHDQPCLAGNYLLQGSGWQMGLAFNYSRRESWMEFFSDEDLKQLLANNHLSHCDVVRNHQKELSSYIRTQREGIPLWRICLILALLSLALEIALLLYNPKKTT